MKTRKIESEMLYRSVQLDPETINKESRTVELSFSSEEPVKRWYGTEILDHSDSAVRLGRINSKGPLLDSHDLTRQIGVIEKAWIDPATRKGRALVRIGNSQLAEEVYRDMTDGIRVNVSVGYRVHKLVLEEESESREMYRATDWEPYEISSVSAPADITVGI
ncbi:MAG: HK97 family phage prohead protease, partial [Spirochaetota bacterium]